MKNKVLFVILIFAILANILIPTVYAAGSSNLPNDVLIRVNGKDIKKTSKIDELKRMFGNPTLETNSPFGGKMYTFYNESKKYNVYVETDSNGVIKNTGVVSENFKSNSYEALQEPENNSYYYYSIEKAIEDYRDGKYVYVGVCVENYTWQEAEKYRENYMKNQSQNLYNLQKHAIYTSKMLAHLEGKKFTQTVASEEIFYMNELLKANKTTLYETLWNNDKYNYVSLISASGYNERDYINSSLPANPVSLGGVTAKYNPKGEDYKYFIYDIGSTKLDNGKYFIGSGYYAVNPDFMNERKTVALTSEEKTKLANVEKMVKEFKNYYEKSGNKAYTTEPNVKELSKTKAYGVMNEDYLKAAVAYLNLARVGIGLEPVKYSKDLSHYAQIKAATVVYLNNYTDAKGVSHYFDKPDWMSQTDYNNSMVGSENLYTGGILGGTVFGSVEQALHDGYGDPITCGHRYNILNPTATTVGLGYAEGQGCHKFTGYNGKTPELVAWPANGIMPMTLITSAGIGNWTASFSDGKHRFTDNSSVSVKNLNSGAVWNITQTNTNNTKLLRKTSDSFITFRDDSIAYEQGDVLEITLKNVKYPDGSIKDYKYRTVFYGVSSLEKKNTTSISTVGNSIKVELGKTKDLKIRLQPADATNKLTYVKSSNSSIASVRADGIVTGKKVGKATITIKCGDITKQVNVEVITVPITSVKLNKTTLELSPKGTATLKATIEPSNTTDNKTVTWTSSNTKVATVDKKGNVTALSVGTAVITAKAGTKTATCKVTVKKQTQASTQLPANAYVGNINSELKQFSLNKNEKGNHYVYGEIVVVEWVNGKSTVPKVAPKMRFKSTDGKVNMDVFVTATGTNTYYFDRFIEGIDTTKQYYFEVASGDSRNVSTTKTMNVYFTAAKFNNKSIGIYKNYKLMLSGQNIKFVKDTYVGNINSELKQFSLNKNEKGNHYVYGEIVVVEWVNGKSTVPKVAPKMRFKSTDGKVNMDVFVTATGTNTYYFDRFIEGIDTTKQYYFEVASGDSRNVSTTKTMNVYFTAAKFNNKSIGTYKNKKIVLTGTKITFK